jgi:uncharacterized protein (DUF4415 family)
MVMQKNTIVGDPNWVDPDDAPPLTPEWFEKANYYEGDKLIRRGRPRSDRPKQQISIRLNPETIEEIRALGPKWQTELREAIRHWLSTKKAERAL